MRDGKGPSWGRSYGQVDTGTIEAFCVLSATYTNNDRYLKKKALSGFVLLVVNLCLSNFIDSTIQNKCV